MRKLKDKWSPYPSVSTKLNAWKQSRVDRYAAEKLPYQKVSSKLEKKTTEWRLQGGGKMLAVDAAGFMFVPSKHLRGATWRNLTPEGRVARKALLEHKQAEFIGKHGEERGLKQYRKWLLKERALTGFEAGAEASIWALTLSPVSLLPMGSKGGAVALRITERAAERGIERVAERAFERVVEKGAEHIMLDVGKHTVEEKLPSLISKYRAKNIMGGMKKKWGGKWLGSFILSHKTKKRPSSP